MSINYFHIRDIGKKISKLSLGTSRLSGTVDSSNGIESRHLLEKAYDEGINFFDTANIYGQGKAEELICRAFRSRRDQIVISSKGGYRLSTAGGMLALLKPIARRIISLRPSLIKTAQSVRSSQMSQDFSRKALEDSLLGSLRRLGTDYLDVYMLHSPSEEILRRGDVFEFLEEFKERGIIRCYGVACLDPSHAILCPPSTSLVQLEVNLLSTPHTWGIIRQLAGRGCSVMARQPFGSGKLLPEAFYRSLTSEGRDSRIQTISTIIGTGSIEKVAIKYLYENPYISSVAFGTTRAEHLMQNISAIKGASLGAAEITALDNISFSQL